MDSLCFKFQSAITSNINSVRQSQIQSRSFTIGGANAHNVRINSNLNNRRFVSVQTRSSFSHSQSEEEQEEGSVEEIRIPKAWLNSSKALEESEWLRVTLHKWLDDEYCPEPTNVDISNVAAKSYYKSLIENQTDLGDILLRMAMDLETISYQESFHGAFSSANAAVNLILQRILHE
ncbi:hypothetical protein HanPI659440_Chr04g0170421 [Helianthus annuus]|uniref:Uncharacterized protein n=1 Tax=Helianthus annuus TaxID=4232 RepID=A0A251TDG0_HELAN|nr:uncharacterized protein LOC110891263 [Helianthus annuus]KAF5811141.1 hypothetical protein HanXRQr2_Chr04g0178001 [Helianthus annuus]KAJ0589921.1 hypothetical protein HanIR_Chr04g0191681 [Helianthus annuus]KAJ0597815.1 hypothetical protein HanHA89_Chr04g0158941 [Helianthus annuus]KAJ0797136.1 hypothetical protein HanPI659440_Chr04g0170421 [Helianthus annuus]KAJ0932276.1 hypothetical protein HanPSC8_Chr04g0171801 [Helianthus annuus]